MIAPLATFLARGADIRNEGTPFRCFGPHTHEKALVAAQARFSEESRSHAGLVFLQHSQTPQAGQVELAEPF